MWRNILGRVINVDCVVLCTQISGAYVKNMSHLAIITRDGDVIFCSETLVSFRPHISELINPSFGRPMQLLRGEVSRFEGWLYTCAMTFQHIDSAVMSGDVVKS